MITPETTISQLVSKDYRTAGVFQRHGMDFCCGGNISLEKACEKYGLDLDTLREELTNVAQSAVSAAIPFHTWSPALLIDYIIEQHHGYLRNRLPVIEAFVTKVAFRHGETMPELVEIRNVFHELAAELYDHMKDEEDRVFPVIRNLTSDFSRKPLLSIISEETLAEQNGQATEGQIDEQTLRDMISELENEHTAAGTALRELRRLTSDFTPPDWACNTYRIAFQELADLEADMHHHVHLENNILFNKLRKITGLA